MGLSSNIVFFQTSATPPTGWARETSFDGRHIRGTTGDDALATGGASSHLHPIEDHTHSVTAGAPNNTALYRTRVSGQTMATSGHGHGTNTSDTASNAGTNTGASTNAPLAYTWVFIKASDGSRSGVPPGACCLRESALATGQIAVNDAEGRLLKGAAAAGAGGTQVGAATHSDHTIGAHAHGRKWSNAGDATLNICTSQTGGTTANGTHTHEIALDSATDTIDTADATPKYEKLLVAQNNTAGELLCVGDIALWTGAAASIPSDWRRRDLASGQDFPMCTNTVGSIGATGGNSVHGHSGSHVAHTVTETGRLVSAGETGTNESRAHYNHTHTWTVASLTAAYANCSSEAAYPLWTKAILIKYCPAVVVNLAALSLHSSVPAPDLVPGPVSIGLSAVHLTETVPQAGAVPGPVSVGLSAIGLAPRLPQASVVPGAVSVGLSAIHLTGTVPSTSAVPGPVSVALQALGLVLDLLAARVETVAGVEVSLSILSLAARAESVSVVPGPVLLALSCISLSASAPTLGVLPGPVIAALQELSLALIAEQLSAVPGPVSVVLEALALRAATTRSSVVPGAVEMLLSRIELAIRAGTLEVESTGPVDVVVHLAMLPFTILALALRAPVRLSDGRFVTVEPELRRVVVDGEQRLIIVPEEADVVVSPEDRTATVRAEDRKPCA